MAILLKGTGLVATSKDGATYTVMPVNSRSTSLDAHGAQPTASHQSNEQHSSPSAGSPPAENSRNSEGLTEIIVTAQKRAEDVRRLAESVTAFTGEALEAMGAQSLQDYVASAPGVVFDQSIPNVSNVTVRGIGTATIGLDLLQSPTAILLDDVPLTDPGFAVSLPDIDVFDLQRVEVLKGPQGTIFGTAALGGAINYITTPVSLSDYDAHAQVGAFGVQHSGDPGYSAKGAVNIPIIADTFGVRLTLIHREQYV